MFTSDRNKGLVGKKITISWKSHYLNQRCGPSFIFYQGNKNIRRERKIYF